MKPGLKAIRERLGDRVVAITEFGSRIYGTNLPSSDWDYKGIMVPTADEILMSECPSGFTERTNPTDAGKKNGPDDVDIEFFSVHNYIHELMEGQTFAIDMLFCPDHQLIEWGPIMEEIWNMRSLLLNSKCDAALGYARSQANKYSLRGTRMRTLEIVIEAMRPAYEARPRMLLEDWLESVGGEEKFMASFEPDTAKYVRFPVSKKPPFTKHLEINGKQAGFPSALKVAYELFKKELDDYGDRARAAKEAGGIDWKAMYHADRISTQTVELLTTGHVQFPSPHAAHLLRVRQGLVPIEEVSARIEQGFENVREAQKVSVLRDKPDTKTAREFIKRVHRDIVRKAYP